MTSHPYGVKTILTVQAGRENMRTTTLIFSACWRPGQQGWTGLRQKSGTPQLNNTASGCNAAHALIVGGYLKRDDLREMTVSAVQQTHFTFHPCEALARTT